MLALKDWLKYYQNYDGSKWKRARENTEEGPQTKRTFKKHYSPKPPVVDVHPMHNGEDQASCQWHIRISKFGGLHWAWIEVVYKPVG